MSAERMAVERGASASAHLFLLVVAASVFVTVLTATMITIVLPMMRAEFGASVAQVGWIVTGYSLAYAIGVPLYGRISDLFGVRRVFSFGLLGFAAGGLICALAPNLTILVAGRIVQGIGGAAVPALASVAVAKVLPPGQRGGALGLTASSVGIGSSTGPVVGGTIGQLLGWRALFVGSLVLMLLVLPFARRVLPNGDSADERRFDLAGGALLGLGAGLFLFGITQGQVAGFAAVSCWGSFLAAALAAVGFVWRIHAAPYPFVSPALFRNRAYVAALLVGFFAMFANLSALVFVALLLVEVNKLSPGAAGLVLTPGAMALALLSPLTGRLSDRVGMRLPIVAGLVVMALALLFISTFAGASPMLIAGGVMGLGAGAACIQSPANNAAANALPAHAVGGGMGLFAGAFFLGGGTGPALIGALLAARQEAGSGALNPFYTLDAAPFSDTFLAMVLALIVALIATFGLRGRSAQTPKEIAPLVEPKAMNDHTGNIHRVQRRTLGVLIGAQVLGGAGLAIGVMIGTLIARDLSGSAALAGLPQTLNEAGTAAAALPLARYMTHAGRRRGLSLGWLVGALGAFLVVASIYAGSLPLLLASMFLFGSASATNDATKYAAADLALPHTRGTSVGTIMFASTVGAIVSPNLAMPAAALAGRLGVPPLAGPFVLAITAFSAAALSLSLFLRPDPLALAGRLGRPAVNEGRDTVSGRAPLPALLRRSGVGIGLGAMVLANFLMVLMMTMTPVHIADHGHGLGVVALAVSLHAAGMFAPSPLTGWLADRLGRAPVIALGGLWFVASGALAAIARPHDTTLLIAALVLLGVGWNFGVIGGSTLLTDAVAVPDRPRVQGVADAAMRVAGMLGGALSGLLLAVGGFVALGILCTVLAAILVAAGSLSPRSLAS